MNKEILSPDLLTKVLVTFVTSIKEEELLRETNDKQIIEVIQSVYFRKIAYNERICYFIKKRKASNTYARKIITGANSVSHPSYRNYQA